MLRLKIAIEFHDKGLAKGMQAIRDAGMRRVEVGLVGPKAETVYEHTIMGNEKDGWTNGLTVAEVGLINEMGSDDGAVPARSFLKEPMLAAQQLIGVLAQIAMRRIIAGDSVQVALDQWGSSLADISRAAIDKSIEPENAYLTVERKGFNHPLIATGLLRDTIGHQIRTTDGETIEGVMGDFDPSDVGNGYSIDGATGIASPGDGEGA